MSVIKINAITVPEDSGDELGQRFAARQSAMKGTPGFEGFELLQPTDGRNTWLVLTRWESEEDFDNWRNSQSFQKSHGHGGKPEGAGHGAAEGESSEAPKQKPVGMSAELWSYTVSTTG